MADLLAEALHERRHQELQRTLGVEPGRTGKCLSKILKNFIWFYIYTLNPTVEFFTLFLSLIFFFFNNSGCGFEPVWIRELHDLDPFPKNGSGCQSNIH
jgi:hypothetical protein